LLLLPLLSLQDSMDDMTPQRGMHQCVATNAHKLAGKLIWALQTCPECAVLPSP
jgi:hypothetical protein